MAQADTKPTLIRAISDTEKILAELRDLQTTPDKSREIATSITQMETAQMWLEKAVQAVK